MRTHPEETTRYGWSDARSTLTAWLEDIAFERADAGGRFAGRRPQEDERVELEVPLVLGRPTEGVELAAWLAAAPAHPGHFWVVLVQAGAAALGLWQDDRLVAHKTLRRYVVRGRGQAQTTYLKTKGKSRYGSRLRLQNAEAQREDIGRRLCDWQAEHGEPDRLFVSCPVREWPELFAADPPPPFDARDPRICRIPLDVRRPSFEELERVHAFLSRGRLRRWRGVLS